MSPRPSTLLLRGRRLLLAGGLALCVGLAPGTAWAEEDPSTPAPPEEITEVLGGEPGVEQGEQEQPAGTGPAATPEEEPALEIPPEVVAAVHELAAQVGISEECVTGVADSIELIGNGVAGLPAELEQLATDLAAAVQQAVETQDPAPLEDFLAGLAPSPEEEPGGAPAPVGGDIAAGLQQLADTLASEACRPAPPAQEPDPTEDPQHPGTSFQPPQGPAAPAPQPPAQPAVYPGYAPTGAGEEGDGSPLAAIGAALAVAGGGAVWTRRRGRATADVR